MSAKKRNLITLVLLLAVGAVLARLAVSNLTPQDPRLLGDPDQIVVETRYSTPWHEKIGVRRGPTHLFDLPRGLRWDTGGTSEQVRKAFGPPQFQFGLLGDDYFVWKLNARYDWDLENAYSGHFLSVAFRFNGRVRSVNLTEELPLDAQPVEQGTDPLPEAKIYSY